MKLAFEARVFSSVDEVPVPPRAAVVTPMRDSRRIAQNRVQRHLCFIEIAEILGPCIDFFLSRRIPGHLAAEWIRLLLPVLGALSHSGFERAGEVGDLLALEVVEYGHEHVAFHLSEHRIPRRVLHHCHGGLVRVFQVPVPPVLGDQAFVVAGQPV